MVKVAIDSQGGAGNNSHSQELVPTNTGVEAAQMANADMVSDEEEGRDPERIIRVRLGSWLLQLPDEVGQRAMKYHPGDSLDIQALVEAICTKLKEDPRVTAVGIPKCDAHQNFPRQWWRGIQAPAERAVVGNRDWFAGVQLSDSIAFSVNVPKKNQPIYRDDEEPGSEQYEVYWDGVAVAVGWEQQFQDEFSNAGGQIVADIIQQALEAVGGAMVVQACGPACQHGFLHTEFAITSRPSGEHKGYSWTPNSRIVKLFLPVEFDPKIMSNHVFGEFTSATRAFADMKNFGQRLLDLEGSARIEFDALLALYQARAEFAARGRLSRLRHTWEERGWKRTAERSIARLWALLSELEGLRRGWSVRRVEFESEVGDGGPAGPIFAMDQDDSRQIESLELGLMQSGVQHIADRLDSRSVSTMTGLGALAGGVAGAIVAHAHF